MIHIIFQNIKYFVAKHRLIFSLFVISQLVSILAIMFIFNAFSSSQKHSLMNDEKYRTFTVDDSSFDASLDKTLQSIADEKGKKIGNISAVCGEGQVHADFQFKTESLYYIDYGKYFTKEDFESGKNQIIVDTSILKEHNSVGDTYKFGNKDYKIIGLSTGKGYHRIPYKSISDKSAITTVQILLSDIPTKSQTSKWDEYLSGKFPNAKVLDPEIEKMSDTAKNLQESIKAIAIGLLAVLNFSYLYKYMLMKRQGQFAVMRICGCKKFKGTMIYLVEVMIISVAAFLISGLVFNFGIVKICRSFDREFLYLMDVKDYLILFAIYIAVIAAVFIPTIAQFSRKKPVELYRKNSI